MSSARKAILIGLTVCCCAHIEGQTIPKAIQPDPDHLWIGSWESVDGRFTTSDDQLKDLNAPHYIEGGNVRVYRHLWKEGGQFHHAVAVPERNFQAVFQFTLGQEATLNVNGTEYRFTYTEENGDLHATVNVPKKNSKFHDKYHVVGDELVKTFTRGTWEAKRWFRRTSPSPVKSP
ncbi:secretory-abundant heat soluble protein 1-like [Paramacrobiotus metropolitanus]|uniref:secretory-abundant heat soluble protein 1-like n=1 Tax=Paramacrobiotus metropolitanus TaxID=2943436 RepID=UPI0024462C68|nr:secretory-abundant heat soluble protein 1-like [Paramacrobiotus metropolitanus]